MKTGGDFLFSMVSKSNAYRIRAVREKIPKKGGGRSPPPFFFGLLHQLRNSCAIAIIAFLTPESTLAHVKKLRDSCHFLVPKHFILFGR